MRKHSIRAMTYVDFSNLAILINVPPHFMFLDNDLNCTRIDHTLWFANGMHCCCIEFCVRHPVIIVLSFLLKFPSRNQMQQQCMHVENKHRKYLCRRVRCHFWWYIVCWWELYAFLWLKNEMQIPECCVFILGA